MSELVWKVSDLIMLRRKIPHRANLLAIIAKMRDDAAGGALQSEAEVIDRFQEQVCDEGHAMIKHVNVQAKAEILLQGSTSAFVLLPCQCRIGNGVGTTLSEIDLRDNRRNIYVYIGGKSKGSLHDLVHRKHSTALPSWDRNAMKEWVQSTNGRKTRGRPV